LDDSPLSWRAPFLDLLAGGLSVRAACKLCCVTEATVYGRRRHVPSFRRMWDQAVHMGTRLLEAEAVRRAVHGVDRPVFHRGAVCGHTTEYSDTLLIFMLKARKPEVYDRGRDDGTGARAVTLNVNVVNVGDRAEPTLVDQSPALSPITVVQPAQGQAQDVDPPTS
jgi:hypothetical protein